jgi:fructose-bisphosphate aldolase class II/tagatose 1,6-diphosphate aldolase GatY/KbaY
MKFVQTLELVKEAKKDHYAIPAMNTNGANYEITRACLEAAQEYSSPLILQVYEPNCRFRGYDFFVHQCRFLCDQLGITIPVALHLDHGKSFESIVAAIKAGFTGVMFDGSQFTLERNITLTRKVVELAHPLDISVEGEIGYVKGNDLKKEKQIGRIPIPEKPETEPVYTTVEEAIEFSRRSGIDMMAISIGTTHGVFSKQENINYELLGKIERMVSIPLVQHGTGGISLENIRRLAASGMSKINFGEPLRYNYIKYFCDGVDNLEHLWHPWRIMEYVTGELKEDIKKMIEATGSKNKA